MQGRGREAGRGSRRVRAGGVRAAGGREGGGRQGSRGGRRGMGPAGRWKRYPPPVLVLLVLPASGGASSGLFRESGGSRSMGTPVWVPFCWMGAAAIMFAVPAASTGRRFSLLFWLFLFFCCFFCFFLFFCFWGFLRLFCFCFCFFLIGSIEISLRKQKQCFWFVLTGEGGGLKSSCSAVSERRQGNGGGVRDGGRKKEKKGERGREWRKERGE